MPAALRFAALALALLASLAAAARGVAQQPAAPASPDEKLVHDVAAQLRCVVCQNLSVADSPSEMANQMRAVIRERLAAGERPEQVIDYFVARYGEWILLAPRREGFTLLVWLLPPLAVAAGLAVAGLMVVRWSRRREPAPATPVDPAMAERIRREMEAEP